jgi:hypothetical protein
VYRAALGIEVIGQLFQDDGRGFTLTFLEELELFSFDVPTAEDPWTPDPKRLGFRALVGSNGTRIR